MTGWSRFMTPAKAQLEGFGSLFTIAENYTKFSMLFPDQGFDFVDAVASPFPKSHDGGMLHHVWISGCKHALSTIDGNATHLKDQILADPTIRTQLLEALSEQLPKGIT